MKDKQARESIRRLEADVERCDAKFWEAGLHELNDNLYERFMGHTQLGHTQYKTVNINNRINVVDEKLSALLKYLGLECVDEPSQPAKKVIKNAYKEAQKKNS